VRFELALAVGDGHVPPAGEDEEAFALVACSDLRRCKQAARHAVRHVVQIESDASESIDARSEARNVLDKHMARSVLSYGGEGCRPAVALVVSATLLTGRTPGLTTDPAEEEIELASAKRLAHVRSDFFVAESSEI
jgi:hypothetical protein